MNRALLSCPPAREKTLCANKPPLAVDDERPSHDRRERHFRNLVELESLVHLEPLPARKREHLRRDRVRESGGHRVSAHHLLIIVFAEPFVGAGTLLAGYDDLACELSVCFLGVEHVHAHETVTAVKQVRDEASVEALTNTARAHRHEGAHDADASQRQACCSELALQGGRVIKEGGAEELQHPILVGGHNRVGGGVRYGEVQVVIRVRHQGTDVLLALVEEPAPVCGGETWFPDQRCVAPSKEVADETFPAEVVLHLAGTLDDGLHHLHSPRGPMSGPVVSSIS